MGEVVGGDLVVGELDEDEGVGVGGFEVGDVVVFGLDVVEGREVGEVEVGELVVVYV